MDPRALEALEALGYVDRAPTAEPHRRGVTVERPMGSADHVYLYSTRREASAVLVDGSGAVLHRWAVPNLTPSAARQSWIHIEPLPNGELLAISQDHSVARYDSESRPIWQRRMRAHHDLAVHPDGRLFVLTRRRVSITHNGTRLPVLADAITVLSAAGTERRDVPLLDLMRPHLDRARLRRIKAQFESEGDSAAARITKPGGVGDVLHTNSIHVLRDAIDGVCPAGSFLLSFRAIHRVAIVDPDLREVLWFFGHGELDGQHDATQNRNGNILIFDNGMRRGYSRVVEVDPRRNEIVWSLAPKNLYTRLRGGAQELPNGNVLITESDRGRALEVTRGGEIVWEFLNPDVSHGGAGASRATIYRLNRFPRAFFGELVDH